MNGFNSNTVNFTSEGKKRIGKIVLIVAGVIVLLVASSIATVPTGHTGILITFGKAGSTTMEPGLHFKAPFISKVVTVNNQVRKNETAVSSSSRDLQIITGTIAVNYHVNAQQSVEIYSKVGMSYELTLIDPAIQESFKAATAQHSAEELITMRQQVSDTAKSLLADKLSEYGVIVDEFNITNLNFSEEFNAAIEAKQTAQQQALKAEQDLKRIEVEAEQQVVQARAEAEATKIEAEAQAEANRALAESITPELVDYQRVQKWDGKYPSVMGGDGTGIIVDGRTGAAENTQG